MAVALFRYDRDIQDDNAKLTLSENISSQAFYEKHWERAIEQLEIKYIKDCGEFDKSKLDIVLEELFLLKNWAEQNLVDSELEYMRSRVENLEIVIPTAFIDDSTILYIF